MFGEPKKEGDLRLITNFRFLNKCFSNDKFKMDSWGTLRSALKNQALRYGLTLDLKSWFHHLGVHPVSRRWMRFKLRLGEAYEIKALPFGLSGSPYWSHRLLKVVLSWIRNNLPGLSIVWYVDDIAILGSTKLQVKQATTAVIDFLTTLGIQVNNKKSMKQAAEQFDYLGQTINLTTGTISPPPGKLKQALTLAKKQLKARTCVPRHLA